MAQYASLCTDDRSYSQVFPLSNVPNPQGNSSLDEDIERRRSEYQIIDRSNLIEHAQHPTT